MFALLGVLTPLKYSLFFANISLSWVYFGLLTFRTCCLSLVDVSKLKNTIFQAEKAPREERLSLCFKKVFSRNSSKFRDFLNLRHFGFFGKIWSSFICTHYLHCKWCKNSAGFRNFCKMLAFLKKSRFLKKKWSFLLFLGHLEPNWGMQICRWFVYSFLKLMDTTHFDFKIVFYLFSGFPCLLY